MTPIDDHLFDVLEDVWHQRKSRDRDAKKAARTAQIPVEPKLPPAEVQRLLRAGKTPAEVAQMAGVGVGWVERFYSMVLRERAGVITDVQNLWLDKPKLGHSGAPLGEAVLQNLHNRHVRLSDDDYADAWNATRRDGQPWHVSIEFSFRGRRQRAVWRYDPHARTLVAGNRLAADLGWVKNGKKAAARLQQGRAKKGRPAKKAVRRPAKKAVRRPAKKKTAKRVAKRSAKKSAKKAARRPARKAARRPVRKAAKRRAPARRRPARRTARRR
jgi:hypothetical protein